MASPVIMMLITGDRPVHQQTLFWFSFRAGDLLAWRKCVKQRLWTQIIWQCTCRHRLFWQEWNHRGQRESQIDSYQANTVAYLLVSGQSASGGPPLHKNGANVLESWTFWWHQWQLLRHTSKNPQRIPVITGSALPTDRMHRCVTACQWGCVKMGRGAPSCTPEPVWPQVDVWLRTWHLGALGAHTTGILCLCAQ